MTDPFVSPNGVDRTEDPLGRLFSSATARRNGRRLKTRLLWYLLLSSVLLVLAVQQESLYAGPVLLSLSGVVISLITWAGMRDVTRRIKGNTYTEYPVGRFVHAVRVLAVLYVVYLSVGHLNVGQFTAVHPLLLVLPAASFLCSIAGTLVWLIKYENANGPVYVVDPGP